MLDKNNCGITGWVNDYEMQDGSKIIGVNSLDFSEWENVLHVIPYPKSMLIEDENGRAIIKSLKIQKEEKYGQLVGQILNDPYLKALIEACRAQLLEAQIPGINTNNAIFEKQECLDWLNKYNSIAKDQQDLSKVSLDEINISMFELPAIPAAFSSRFPVTGILAGA